MYEREETHNEYTAKHEHRLARMGGELAMGVGGGESVERRTRFLKGDLRKRTMDYPSREYEVDARIERMIQTRNWTEIR
jgi:hypothetical protein